MVGFRHVVAQSNEFEGRPSTLSLCISTGSSGQSPLTPCFPVIISSDGNKSSTLSFPFLSILTEFQAAHLTAAVQNGLGGTRNEGIDDQPSGLHGS